MASVPSPGFRDPLTTQGDLVYRGASATTRLAAGTSGHFLKSSGTDVAYAAITESDISDLQTYLVVADIDTLAELNTTVTDATLGDVAGTTSVSGAWTFDDDNLRTVVTSNGGSTCHYHFVNTAETAWWKYEYFGTTHATRPNEHEFSASTGGTIWIVDVGTGDVTFSVDMIFDNSSGITLGANGDLAMSTTSEITGTSSNITFASGVVDVASGELRETGIAVANVEEANLINGFRVNCTTADPTADANGTSLYMSIHKGNKIGLYDGTNWNIHESAEISITNGGLSADTIYDVFVYDNAGTLTLELVAWTDATTRATAIVFQDGIRVKSGATTRRLIATVRTGGGTSFHNETTSRYIFNFDNQIMLNAEGTDSTNTWTYTSITWRAFNNSSATNSGHCVIGEGGIKFRASVSSFSRSTASTDRRCGIGVNSTTAITGPSSQIHGNNNANEGTEMSISAEFRLGYNAITALENSSASGTTTWNGDAGDPTNQGQHGIFVNWMG